MVKFAIIRRKIGISIGDSIEEKYLTIFPLI